MCTAVLMGLSASDSSKTGPGRLGRCSGCRRGALRPGKKRLNTGGWDEVIVGTLRGSVRWGRLSVGLFLRTQICTYLGMLVGSSIVKIHE